MSRQKQTESHKTNVERTIARALGANRKRLDAAESRSILAAYGIPVVRETLVHDADTAAGTARETGYPVVVKGVGAKFPHKTEQGLVRLNLKSGRDVRRAVAHIRETAGTDLEGILVQPQLNGSREFVAGLFRDPQFGAVVMFGLGGVFTEAFNDVSFRLAPVDEGEMAAMIEELSARALLDDFRGEKRVDRHQLHGVLTGLSQMAHHHPEIREVDINPLLASPQGRITAVDALVVLGADDEKAAPLPPVAPHKLHRLFNPRTVAFVGASATMGKWGHMLLTNTIAGGYEGRIYPVNPKGGTIAGQKVYPSVADIDDKIDLAVVTIPAKGIPALIPRLAAKETRGMLLITSGFRETGAAGQQLEAQVTAAARKAGMVMLGPNTMGICNPHSRLFCNSAHVRPLPGTTALICQSGNMGTQLLSFAELQDIGIRAYAGSGNEAMVTVEDYMEAFEDDELTKTLVIYLESVKNGHRFFNSAKRISRTKPIVILRGGRTHAGERAAVGHTGAMASDVRVFDAACRQAGIIQVKKPMELLDLSAVFSALPLPRGNRVAIITLGGGWGVVTADLCAQYQLELPPLPQKLIDNFNKILPDYWSHANPVDIVGEIDPRIPKQIMEALLKWEGCDTVIHLGIHGKQVFVEKMLDSVARCDPGASESFLSEVRKEMTGEEKAYREFTALMTEKYQKPVVGVSLLTDRDARTLYRIPGRKYKSVFFPSPERAVKALAGMCRYREWLDRQH